MHLTSTHHDPFPMNFQTTTAERIGSISQRALLYWQRPGRAFPAPGEFNPAERMHDPKQLVIWQVEQHGA